MNFSKEPFDKIFSKEPLAIKNGIPYYGSEREGDQFNEDDVATWTKGGRFASRWNSKGQANEYCNEIYSELCRRAAALDLPIIDIASGPGLGLIPDVFVFNPRIKMLAADACPVLIEKWSEYLKENAPEANMQFVCLNIADMPIASDSVDIITSNIGFSSLRCAGDDQMQGLHEVYRVLKPGGYVFAIENEHEDKAVIQKVFDLWGKENWFRNNKLTWRERFEQTGFIVEQEQFHLRRIENNDWELGEVAASFGLEIAVVFKAYILRKQ